MKTKTIYGLVGSIALLGAGLLMILSGCSTTNQTASQPAATVAKTDSGKGAAQLWAENCARCHNIRSPSAYSDSEWEVAMLHMRVRANLTAEEHRKILEFLKAGN